MTYLSLSVLGGLVALDGTSLGQFMMSRPIVAATVAGWVLGDPVSGLLMGAVLEAVHLSVVPVGGARFPEVGPAAVVAATTSITAGGGGGLALGCLMALAWGQLGGTTIVLLRRFNTRLAPDPFEGPVTPADAERTHLVALGLDFIRGTVLTSLGILVGVKGVAPAATFWPVGASGTLALLIAVASMAAGALLRSLGGARRRGVLFAVGAIAGLVGGLLL